MAEPIKGNEITNMVFVVDKHCAEHTPRSGLGLKPPTVEHHLNMDHDNRGSTSRISVLVGLIGKDLTVLVSHFHCNIARSGGNTEQKKKYYSCIENLIDSHKL